ncbi:MAG: pseudouridine synthase [Bacillota bacterium]
MSDLTEERLQKILARAGIASRREAERMIEDGRVKVDGEPVDRLGLKVDPEKNRVEVDGKQVSLREPPVYLMFFKPAGVVTTVSDPQGRPKVIDFLHRIKERVFPVGRLDFDSEGLLLLTNDGELAHRLTHPRFKVPKVYLALVDRRVDREALAILRKGVELNDGTTRPAQVEVARRESARTLLRITVSEGRKRQVRRMCAAVGHPVIELRRVSVGPLRLDGLQPGGYRHLTNKEVELLKRQVGL